MEKALQFFTGDEMAAAVWHGKYRMDGEQSPEDMFKRWVKEITRIEMEATQNLDILFAKDQSKFQNLSNYGKERFANLSEITISTRLSSYLNFQASTPGGSMMQGIGNKSLYSSLSNCFVVGAPHDSYAGINKKANELPQIMKRRGGGGTELSTIRPRGAKVNNQAGTSTGIMPFAERFSTVTLEVAQEGRRGALMLTCDIRHPDSMEFIQAKQDLTKLTGANLSNKIPDDFMEAVVSESDYILRWPIVLDEKEGTETDISGISPLEISKAEYGVLMNTSVDYDGAPQYWKKINAKEYWNELIRCAWNTAEPGIIFTGNWAKYGLDWMYPQYRPISTNPCSEIPMQPYDACRLIARNVLSLVDNPFTPEAKLNRVRTYKAFYEQLVIAEWLINLEVEHIDRIIDKVTFDASTPEELKNEEIILWNKIKETAQTGRRCGCGFTGLGDMLAALLEKYYSPVVLEDLFKIKLQAELDATTDLAILFGSFDGFNFEAEQSSQFMQMIKKEFPTQWERMRKFGRRHVSWSTAAPVGSGSILTQTTSGIEPLYTWGYQRRKKCITSADRVDYVDPADGQKFTVFYVLHPQFKKWILEHTNQENMKGQDEDPVEALPAEVIEAYFKESPWYGQCAEDLNWQLRVEVQAIVQKYTTHAISSTINLPADVDPEIVANIYMESWKVGLKGNTVYRDGARGGVIVKANNKPDTQLGKRPIVIPGHYYTLKAGGQRYSIMIGFSDLECRNPYEIFIASGLDDLPEVFEEFEYIEGEIVRDTKEWYNFETEDFTIREINDMEQNEKIISLMISTMLATDIPLAKVIKTIAKSKPIAGGFTFKLNKILAKYMDGEKTDKVCPECGEDAVVFENGCYICKNCGSTKC